MVEVEEDNSYFYFSGPASFVNGGCSQHSNAYVLYAQDSPIIHTGDTRIPINAEILIEYSNEPITTENQVALCPIPGCRIRIFTIQ